MLKMGPTHKKEHINARIHQIIEEVLNKSTLIYT